VSLVGSTHLHLSRSLIFVKIALAARPLSELASYWSHKSYRTSLRWYLSMAENPATIESASNGFPFVTKYFAARNTAVR